MAIYPVDFDTPHRGLEWLQYYSRHNVYHPGVDLNKGIGNEDLGLPVKCPVDGEIEYVSPEPGTLNRNNGGFGWFVLVYHPAYGKWTRYAHLNKVSVRQNQKVKEGTVLGELGKTGTIYAHLHWEGWEPAMYEIQRRHWRRFGYYPIGKSKAFVSDHYFNPLKWVDDLNKKPDWRKKEEEWASQFIKDMPGLLGDYDPHRWIALIHRATEK